MAGTISSRTKLLTVQEAAAILNVHENTIRRWCDRGIFRYYEISPRGDRRISMSEVNAFLKMHLHKSEDEFRSPQ